MKVELQYYMGYDTSHLYLDTSIYLDEYFSRCHSIGVSDPWWEHPDPSIFFSTKRLLMQQQSRPYISAFLFDSATVDCFLLL